MNLSLGIVGLPNVGKSTLFNALTNNDVPAQNYPFCTIDPNVGIVPVMDPRLDELTKLINPAKTTPAVIEFWDIAGLVKGAATGAGLGNKFLANIRSVSAIVHVVRAFVDGNVTHVENSIDPKRDIDLINTELILKDLETVTTKLKQMSGKPRAEKDFQPQYEALEALTQHLDAGKLANSFTLPANESAAELIASLFLLTAKPVIYVVNTTADKAAESVEMIKSCVSPDSKVIPMDIKLEFEVSTLPPAEQAEYLEVLQMSEPALAKLTREAYSLLGLMSFFTAGEQEVRAWTITEGMTAPQAAGVIHTDFEKHFITAEIVKFTDFIVAGGWIGAKEQGKIKLAGRDYIMQDGEVVLFRHNA